MSFSWMKWTPAALALLMFSPTAWGQDCCPSCKVFCCPHYKHQTEGGPRICFWPCCGRPVNNLCVNPAPNWGYYQTCWSPWPWGPDWSHCPVQPPASLVWPPGAPEVLPSPNRPPTRQVPPGSVLPAPRPLD